MAVPTLKITPAQLKRLGASARALGMGEGDLHRLAAAATGKQSLRLLTLDEAWDLIDRLEAEERRRAPARVPEEGEPTPANLVRLATPAQIDLISELIAQLGWHPECPDFRACVRRATGKDVIRTTGGASKVIDMLAGKVEAAARRGKGNAPPSGEPPAGQGRMALRQAQREGDGPGAA